MDKKEYLRWVKPSINHRSLNSSNFRYRKAEEQAEMTTVSKEKIIEYVNEFLSKIGMMTTKEFKNSKEKEKEFDPIVTFKKVAWEKGQIEYAKMASQYGYDIKENIVWIKLTKNEYISVIGTGCDISFSEYAKSNTTAGRIIERLINTSTNIQYEWDDSYVLIFPLKGFPDDLNRSDIESGIGNYLIGKNVPILDFYSHDY